MKFSIPILFLISLSSLQAQNDSLQLDSTDRKTTIHDSWNEESLKERYSMGFDFTYGYSYRTIKSEKYPELINCRNEHEQAVYLPKAGINFHYRINKWIQFNTGINYLKTGFDHKEIAKLNDTLSTEFTIACNEYDAVSPSHGFIYYGFFDPRFLYIFQNLHPSQCDRLIELRYDYLEVPITIRLSYQRRNFNFNFYGGTSIDYLLKESIHNVFTSNGTVVAEESNTIPLKAYSIRTKINFSWLAGAGFRYSVNKKLSIELHGGVQKQLFNIFEDEFGLDYQEYQYRYEVGIGVYYILNRK